MVFRSPFCGPRRKLVLAFDVGTTFSGISYSVLDPGQVPEIQSVVKFPAHEDTTGASKIPTVIYYDRNGKVKAVGAEATREGIDDTAEDEQWMKAEWFKLHLRSKVAPDPCKEVVGDTLLLPPHKSAVEVFADFLAYLFECASSYIQDTPANGADLWASVKDDIDFILSHPNGWQGIEQTELRKAAILAGLIPDTTAGHARLSFVTEGEASLHFAVRSGLLAGVMMEGDGVIVVDAGGGSIDVSSYGKDTKTLKDEFAEIAAPQSYLHGSVFVNIHAQRFLENFLAGSSFADDVEHIVRCFDETTKLRFRDVEQAQYVKFGSMNDNDPSCDIRFGQLKLLGSDIALFFEPSIDCIIKAVRDQRRMAHKPISHIVLVGGFAASAWVFLKVHEALALEGLNVIRPEHDTYRAVSDGAISFYLDHIVRTRAAKVTYGIFGRIPYDPTAADHRERSAKAYTTASGHKCINDAFDVILFKNTQVSEMKEYRKSYFSCSESMSKFKGAALSVWCYRGSAVAPKWKDVDTENYTQLFTIKFDLSDLQLTPLTKSTGSGTFYRIDVDIVLLFGLTELKAQVAWTENGVEKRSPIKIVYDPSTNNDPDVQAFAKSVDKRLRMLNKMGIEKKHEAARTSISGAQALLSDCQSPLALGGTSPDHHAQSGHKDSQHAQQRSEATRGRLSFFTRWIGSGKSFSPDKYKEECSRLRSQNQRLREDMSKMAAEYHKIRQQYAEAEHERQRYKDSIDSFRRGIGGILHSDETTG